MDVIRRIKANNSGRDAVRVRLKYRAMRSNAFAFLRGSCHLFYQQLPRGGVFKSVPKVWVCGDLHLENFGSYKGDNRLAYFDINDFDESALAPASWDLVRFLASLRIASDGSAIGREATQAACRAFLEAYGAALASGKAYWVERDTATGVIRNLLDHLRDRHRLAFLDTRTVLKGKKRVLRVDGGKAIPVSPEQREEIAHFMQEFATAQPNPDFYRVLDVAAASPVPAAWAWTAMRS